MIRSWRRARTVIEQTQAETAFEKHAAQALGVVTPACSWCRPGGYGYCTCPETCGEAVCSCNLANVTVLRHGRHRK